MFYCAESEKGNYTQINTAMISGGRKTVVLQMIIYLLTKNVVAGRTYWYRLEDVSIDGKAKMHDAISVKIDEN